MSLTVNGEPTTVDVPLDMPLLWVLRDVRNLKGTKFGCGISQCGACTVHLAGAAAGDSRTVHRPFRGDGEADSHIAHARPARVVPLRCSTQHAKHPAH